MRNSIRKLAGARETQLASERGLTPEGQVLEILNRLNTDRLPLKAIVAAFIAEYAADYQRLVTSRYIGSLLRRLGLNLYKSGGIFVLAPGQTKTAPARKRGCTPEIRRPRLWLHRPLTEIL